jgi:myo-inositol-1(or 4)-monophosphatase
MSQTSQFLSIAKNAAETAGELVKNNFRKNKIVSKKTGSETVTDTDIASEKIIKKIIQKKYPDHNFTTEELANQKTDSDYTWYIDPIDGTTNFSRGIPHFSISIGLKYKNEIIVGVVFDPIKNEMFTGEKNKGAFLNNKKIKVSNTKLLKNSILATGFAYDCFTNPNNNTKQISAFVPLTSGIRRFGGAALDICYVAAGRFDGYWERNIKPWDLVAGIIILKEAGGKITDYGNKKIEVQNIDQVIASNGKIHQEMYDVIKKSYAK